MRDASAIALAGGRSARFGSDKALATFRGAPLLTAVLLGLRAEFGEVLLVAKSAGPYAALGARVALDRSELYTPLCALYRREPCLRAATELLARSAVGPKRLLDAVRTAFVDWSDERPFLDADTPEQLARLESGG